MEEIWRAHVQSAYTELDEEDEEAILAEAGNVEKEAREVDGGGNGGDSSGGGGSGWGGDGVDGEDVDEGNWLTVQVKVACVFI